MLATSTSSLVNTRLNLVYELISKTIYTKVCDHSRGWPDGSLFRSYYTEVWERALLLSQDCSTLPLIRTLFCWLLSKEISSTIFKVFGMTRPGIEPRPPGPLANTLPTLPMRIFPDFPIFLTLCQTRYKLRCISYRYSKKTWGAIHINIW